MNLFIKTCFSIFQDKPDGKNETESTDLSFVRKARLARLEAEAKAKAEVEAKARAEEAKIEAEKLTKKEAIDDISGFY